MATMKWLVTLQMLAVASALLMGIGQSAADSNIWVTAYYPVWEQRGTLPPDKIDYSALSDLIQFAIMPTSSGDIDQSGYNAVTPEISADVVGRAHAAGDKVIIGLGGMDSGPALSVVIAPAVRARFIANLLTFVTKRGYDGIDIDMEPIASSDITNFADFIRELRSGLDAVRPGLLLTAAVQSFAGPQQALFESIESDFDQINVMTYDLSGTWPGFRTWYNSSLYDDGSQLLTSTVPYPSVKEALQRYIDAGVPASKLGLGIAFYGYVWTGASGPTQPITKVTTQNIAYSAIMDQYYPLATYTWDKTAHAPYLSIHSIDPSKDAFVSYDDARLCREKIQYAKTHGFGGVIIFSLGSGYRANQPAGKQDELLQAVKHAWKGR